MDEQEEISDAQWHQQEMEARQFREECEQFHNDFQQWLKEMSRAESK